MEGSIIKQKREPRIDNCLRDCLKERGYTQKEAAAILKVSPSQVSLWRRGKQYPSLPNAFALGLLCRRQIEAVFDGLYDKERAKVWKKEKTLGLRKDNLSPPFLLG